MSRPICFLTDLGIRDEAVGVCHAVMARIAPDSRVIDISHGVAPLDIQAGALTLLGALPYLPADAIVLAIVDPGSGTDRAPLAVRTVRDRLMVGPDNGVLSLAWAQDGGLAAASRISSPDVILQPASPVLNVRDVFSPAAAHLAAGADLEDLGEPLDPGSLAAIRLPEPEVQPRRIAAEVLDIDRFGNVRLNVKPAHLASAGFAPDERLELATTAAGARVSRIQTYREVQDDLGALEDPWGWVSIIRYGASAAEVLGVRVGDPIWVAAAD